MIYDTASSHLKGCDHARGILKHVQDDNYVQDAETSSA